MSSSSHSNIPTIDDSAIISSTAIIEGPVTIGPGSIVHPLARIIGVSPIEIGSNNIIEEQVTITNTQTSSLHTVSIRIGDNNLFEVGSYFENSHAGSLNTFESRSHCSSNCLIGDSCIVGAGVQLKAESIADRSIVYCGASTATAKPITRKLGLLTSEEMLENHSIHRNHMALMISNSESS